MTHAPFELSSPDRLLACIPHLLGHAPRDSLVVAVTDTTGALVLTARADWPEETGRTAWAEDLAVSTSRAANGHGAHAVLIGYVETATGASAAVEDAAKAFAEAGIPVSEALLVAGTRWRHARRKPQRASLPREISEEAIADVEALFGPAPTQTREQVAMQYAENTRLSRSVRRLLDERGGTPEQDRQPESPVSTDAEARDLVQQLTSAGERYPSEATARLIRALRHTRTRDTILFDILQCPDAEAGRARQALALAIAQAPRGERAPLATLAACCYFAAGNGLATGALLAEALEDDPDYGLALLLHEYYSRGVHPEPWVRGVLSLTRDTVLGIAGAPRGA